jgi:acyl-[acyl-carrier-protein]-phospholipid O-acyltransferase/long-chain-fatty-acid--[acyl-carrier-protein] ligase
MRELLIGGGILVVVMPLLFLLGLTLFPRWTMRSVFKPLLILRYRKRIVGLENLPRNEGLILVSNHVSWIDGILILWILPRNVRFIVAAGNFQGWFMTRVAGAFDTILMTASPKSIARALQTGREAAGQGDVIGIFPEGGLTRSSLLKGFRPGLTKLLKDRNAQVLPVWLDGMWGSVFSFAGGRFFFKIPQLRRRLITLYIDKPLSPDTSLTEIRSHVAALGAIAMENKISKSPTLPHRIIKSWKRSGRSIKAADSTGAEVSGHQLLMRTLILQRILRRELLDEDDRFVGILLPPSVGAVATNVALSFDHRVAINLNYTASSETLNQCLELAGVRKVLTSKKFREKMNLDLRAEMIDLEDVRSKVRLSDKLFAAAAAYAMPSSVLSRMLGLQKIGADDLLTVVFTSGSTGMPKGVMLTYGNVGHNVDAVDVVINLRPEDTVLGILPFFHSFGYSITLWGAMTLPPSGVFHFNPLDAKTIGKLAERYRATVLLATPTFLRGFLRRVQPEQFKHLDVVVAGAEKMPPDLFDAFEDRFGVRISEGYGTTELSPLVSVNVPKSRSISEILPDRCEGSVGRPVPGVAAKIVDPDTLADLPGDAEGMLLIAGPNVMQGYMGRQDLTDEVIRDGWYVTGDMAKLDSEGFIHITGRQSRFSKIGGEMVPHIRVEEELVRLVAAEQTDVREDADDDSRPLIMVTSVADPKKGERLIVLHRSIGLTPDRLRAGLAAAGLPNLYIPASDAFHQVEEIPLLGSGKLDLKAAKSLAESLVGAGKADATVAPEVE